MRRDGFTLVETLIVVVIMGIVLAFGIPKFRETQIRGDVRGARNAVANWHARARSAATSTGRTATMNISGNRILLTRSPRQNPTGLGACACDTLGIERLDSMFHVTATSTNANLVIMPTGLGGGATENDSTLVILSRNGIADTVTISRFGRVLK
jgi:prepilin-type N-terminal cleavage/methylation domain-containing protein